MSYDVLIIGGGVLGLSLAHHLASRNQRVLVIEREKLPGMHASGKNAGMFRKLYRNSMLTEWANESQKMWPKELRKTCFRQTGSCIVGRHLPHHHEELFEERIISASRGAEKKSVSAVFSASDGLLDSPAYMNGLFTLTKQLGVTFALGEEVFRTQYYHSSWHVETIQGNTFSATWIVNAAGAWLNEIIHEGNENVRLDVAPFARHLFVVGGFPSRFMPTSRVGFYWDEELQWYLRAWDKTSRLVSICDRLPATPELFVPESGIHERLSQTLISSLGKISESLYITHSWHCFRTYTKDQLPIIGEDPLLKQFYWLGGFGGFGMSTSFAATKEAANAILGEESTIPVEFSPRRIRLNKQSSPSSARSA